MATTAGADAPAGTAGGDLFAPLTIKSVTLRNRIGLPPMATWQADEKGAVTEFHHIHYGARAMGGAGLIIVEATAVSSDVGARIVPGDLGIWSDEHVPGLRRLAATIAQYGAVPAIQLGHGGRKGATQSPQVARFQPVAGPADLQLLAPSAIPWSDAPSTRVPRAMSTEQIRAAIAQYVAAAKRARTAGFVVLELHAAHGCLLHQFLSPLANARADEYGGSFDNRTRVLRELVTALRHADVWPTHLPLFVRLSCVDWAAGGWTLDETVQLARVLKSLDVDVIDCSSGGILPREHFETRPCYQVPFAARVKRDAAVPTAAVGLICTAQEAQSVVASGQADLVLIGREMLRSPNWPLLAARTLHHSAERWPPAYHWCLGPRDC